MHRFYPDFHRLSYRFLTALMLTVCFVISPTAAVRAQSLAITFDDGFQTNGRDQQASKDNQSMLRALKKHGVKSMLFPAGAALEHKANLDMIKAWGKAGHALGNHTYSHQALSVSRTQDFLADVARAQSILSPLQGWCPRLRFPYLDESNIPMQHNEVMQWLNRHGYGIASATISLADWDYDKQYLELSQKNNATQKQKFRDQYIDDIIQSMKKAQQHWLTLLGREPTHVMLLHANHLNAASLDQLLQRIKKEGWTLVSPAQAFDDPIYQRTYQENGASGLTLPNPRCY